MCYCPTPTLHLNLALTGDGAFQLSPQKTYSLWFIRIFNYGELWRRINHLLLVIPVSYLCHYTNLCPHKPHKHAHTHTHTHTHTTHTHPHPHTHTHTHTHIYIHTHKERIIETVSLSPPHTHHTHFNSSLRQGDDISLATSLYTGCFNHPPCQGDARSSSATLISWGIVSFRFDAPICRDSKMDIEQW